MPDGVSKRCGYGNKLIARAMPYQLRTETMLEITDDGVQCRVVLRAIKFSYPIVKRVP